MLVRVTSLMRVTLVVLLAVSLTACEVVGGIFKAGVWVGAIAVIVIAVALFWVVAKVRG